MAGREGRFAGTVDSLSIGSFEVGLGLLVVSPAFLLVFGWQYLRVGRYDRADTLATLAGVASWILLGLEALVVAVYLALGNPLFRLSIEWQAIFSYPPVLWFFARALSRSIGRRRAADVSRRREEREAMREERP